MGVMFRAPLDALAAISESVLALGVSDYSGVFDGVHAEAPEMNFTW